MFQLESTADVVRASYLAYEADNRKGARPHAGVRYKSQVRARAVGSNFRPRNPASRQKWEKLPVTFRESAASRQLQLLSKSPPPSSGATGAPR